MLLIKILNYVGLLVNSGYVIHYVFSYFEENPVCLSQFLRPCT